MSESSPLLASFPPQDSPLHVNVRTTSASSSSTHTPALASFSRTTLNITKCFVGAASLELPSAVYDAGLIGAPLGILVLAGLSWYTLSLLARCSGATETLARARKHARPTYPQLAHEAFGAKGEIVAWFGLLAMTVGVCGSYFVFMSTAASCMLRTEYWSALSPGVCVLFLLPIVIMLSWLRSFKFLAPFSAIGIVALLFALVASMRDAAKFGPAPPLSDLPLFPQSSHTFSKFLGNAAFLYLIHSVVLPISQTMRQPKKYDRALSISVAFVTVLNLVFAVFVFRFYGTTVKGNVIDNLKHGFVKSFVRVTLSLDLLCTGALFLFPAAEALEVRIFGVQTFGQWRTELKRNVLRAVLVGVITATAFVAPNFSALTALSGGFGNNIVGFLLPPAIYIKLQWRRGYWTLPLRESATDDDPTWPSLRRRRAELALLIFIFAFGLVLMGLSIDSFVRSVQEGHKTEC